MPKSELFFLFHFQLHHFIKTETFSWPAGLGVLGGVRGGVQRVFPQMNMSITKLQSLLTLQNLLLKKNRQLPPFFLWSGEDTEIAGFQIAECANTANQSLPLLNCKTPHKREWKNRTLHHRFHHRIFSPENALHYPMEVFAAVIYLLSYFCPATKAKAKLTETD